MGFVRGISCSRSSKCVCLNFDSCFDWILEWDVVAEFIFIRRNVVWLKASFESVFRNIRYGIIKKFCYHLYTYNL